MHIGSNQGIYSITSAAAVPLASSIIIIILTAKEVLSRNIRPIIKKIIIGMLAVVMILQISSLAWKRYSYVFWENSLDEQVCYLEYGPQKGLMVSEARKTHYDMLLDDTVSFRLTDEPLNVLFISKYSWQYLTNSNIKMATFSGWLSDIDDYIVDKFIAYYELNPNKLPDVIYVEPTYIEVAEKLCSHYDYSGETTALGSIIYRLNK
jgi:hypothetical protein